MAHIIFGDLTPSHPGQAALLAPPSPYARRLPIHSHPSTGFAIKPPWTSKMKVQAFVDPVLLSHNDPRSPARTTAESVGGGGVEWGAWFELIKNDRLTTSSIPFFCDSFVNMPALLPESELGSGVGKRRLAKRRSRNTCIDQYYPVQLVPYHHHDNRVQGQDTVI